MKGNKKLEAIEGSIDQRVEAIRHAAVKWCKENLDADEKYPYADAVLETQVLMSWWDNGRKSYLIDYTAEETGNTWEVTFSNPQPARVKVTAELLEPSPAVVPAPTGAEAPVSVVKESSEAAPPAEALKLEAEKWSSIDLVLEEAAARIPQIVEESRSRARMGSASGLAP